MNIPENRFTRLVAHFFAGFLDNDLLVSPQYGIQNLLAQTTGLLVAPGLFYCLLSTLNYGSVRYPRREFMAWNDRLMFVHCAMVLTSLLTIVEWDALFPDRRDYQILGPLPITARLIFLAKVCSVLGLLIASWAALNIGTAVLFPTVSLARSDSFLTYLQHIGAHMLATLAGSAFVFLLFTGVQGVLLNVLPPRWYRRVSVYVQLFAVLALILAFLLMPVLVSQAGRWIPAGHWLTRAIPSFWFMGLYQVVAGRSTAVFLPLASLALTGLGTVFTLSTVAYVASYRRHLKKSLESMDKGAGEPGVLVRALSAGLNRFLLRDPLERAHFHFAATTLLRSRLHRLLLAAGVALGLGVSFALAAAGARDVLRGVPSAPLLAIQFVVLALVLAAMRFAFTVPAELKANWVFQTAASHSSNSCAAGVRKALLAVGASPVLMALAPLHLFCWGWAAAIAHLIYGALLSALIVELLMLGFEKIPFTCTYLPGKANLKTFWSAYLSGFCLAVYSVAALETRILSRPIWLPLFCAIVLIAIAGIRRRSQHVRTFMFEDEPDPAVRTLDIAFGCRMGPRAACPSTMASGAKSTAPIRT